MNISSLLNSIASNSNQITNNALTNLNTPSVANADSINPSIANISGEGGSSFKDMVSNEIEKLNNQQIKADKLTQGFISGEVDDLHTVLIATEEARLSLELAVQVRNKCVEAYKEINNMQL